MDGPEGIEPSTFGSVFVGSHHWVRIFLVSVDSPASDPRKSHELSVFTPDYQSGALPIGHIPKDDGIRTRMVFVSS